VNLKIFLFKLLTGILILAGTLQAQNPVGGGQIADLVKFCSEKRGFNLLGKYSFPGSNKGFTEQEFSMIHDLGFNFVRLPLDYRTYTLAGDWDSFLENELVKIDKAIEWGSKYGVHVCINIHRAPGYCVNPATLPLNQQLNLWTDSVALKAFTKHWEFFANRYKDISPELLSFNLLNEPGKVTEEVYVQIMKKVIQVIHKINPNRVVFVDGIDYGRLLIPALKDMPNIAQSIHCYDPSSLTHYKAEWVSGSMDLPVPSWPMYWIQSYLYGTWKSEFKSPLVIQGNFSAGTEVIVNVRQVSLESTLSIKAGVKAVLSKQFVCGADLGTDFTKINKTEWGYQNISNKDFSVVLSEPATSLTFENSSGDWMILNSIAFKQGEKLTKYVLSDNNWGKKQSSYVIDENGELKAIDGRDLLPFDIYRKNVATAKANNIPFMVQEFGVYNKTPHTVAIGFLSDLTDFFAENKIGWALWEFNGSFGILNSGRSDCTYESYQGYKLDRELLDVLTTHSITSAFIQLTDRSLIIFPSPATKMLNISSYSLHGKTKVEITNMSGRKVRTYDFVSAANDPIRLDISGLKSNLYLLTARTNGTILTGKFVVVQ
jgi:aryl-phospho-beta-D-glucosidase BglC (GH1 family)